MLQLLDGVGPARARRILHALRPDRRARTEPRTGRAGCEQVPDGSRAARGGLFAALREARSQPPRSAGTCVEGLCAAIVPLVRLRYHDGAIRVGDLEQLAAAARRRPSCAASSPSW